MINKRRFNWFGLVNRRDVRKSYTEGFPGMRSRVRPTKRWSDTNSG